MNTEVFVRKINDIGIDFFTGVPDSTLKSFCDYINYTESDNFTHFVAPNEGSAVGLATGNYLATGKTSLIYMQNSGIGNAVNPITSLAKEQVYGIPMLFVIGYRGEPGVHDEPQHKFMGKITTTILDTMEIQYSVIDKDTTVVELEKILSEARARFSENKQYAIIVKKGTFEKNPPKETIDTRLVRENAISCALSFVGKDDIVVSTTGKISREVYEQSDIIFGDHRRDFLTVGGMGHASMIAFGIANKKREKKVFCFDGDGAVLMHMGSLAFLGKEKPENLIHICFNNDSHESVGGMPTAAAGLTYADIAEKCGYEYVGSAKNLDKLKECLSEAVKLNRLAFVEVKVGNASRENLSRPKETAMENRINFMKYIQ